MLGLIVFAVLTVVLWWALQNQLDTGLQAAHDHGHNHAAPAAKAASLAKSAADDLTKIEGIGPAIRKLLAEHGIATFAALAASKPAAIEKILAAGGKRFNVADASTWPQQATLAAKGDWAALKKLQDKLTGGR